MDKKEKPKAEYITFAADLDNFTKQIGQIENDYNIIEKHISTQMVQIPNPAKALTGLHQPNQPEFITQIIISGLIKCTKKIK